MKERTFYNKGASYKEILKDYYLVSKKYNDEGIYDLWKDENSSGTLFVDKKQNGSINKILFEGTNFGEDVNKISVTREECDRISHYSYVQDSGYKGFVKEKGSLIFITGDSVISGLDKCAGDMQRMIMEQTFREWDVYLSNMGNDFSVQE